MALTMGNAVVSYAAAGWTEENGEMLIFAVFCNISTVLTDKKRRRAEVFPAPAKSLLPLFFLSHNFDFLQRFRTAELLLLRKYLR